MGDFHRETLRKVIQQLGVALAEDLSSLKGRLADAFRNQPSEAEARGRIETLMLAAENGVIDELQRGHGSIPYDLLASGIADRLHGQKPFERSLLRWAVDSWAIALNLISSDEIAAQAGVDSKAEATRTMKSPKEVLLQPQPDLLAGASRHDAWTPASFRELIGHKKIKQTLSIAIAAAQARGESLGHVLLYGPEHVGKMTFASAIANEIGADCQVISGSSVRARGDLRAFLIGLPWKAVLIVSDADKLNAECIDLLARAMAQREVEIMIGGGTSARSHTLELKPFTAVILTTAPGCLSSHFRDSFEHSYRMEPYCEDELTMFAVIYAKRSLDIGLTSDAAEEIAKYSRGLPANTAAILRRARDFAQVRTGEGPIDLESVTAALNILVPNYQRPAAYYRSLPNGLIARLPNEAKEHCVEILDGDRKSLFVYQFPDRTAALRCIEELAEFMQARKTCGFPPHEPSLAAKTLAQIPVKLARKAEDLR